MKINKLILAILLLTPLTLNATNRDMDSYFRCRELWIQFINFIEKESVVVCRYKMLQAENFIEKAVNDLSGDQNNSAKTELKMAIDVLASTTVDHCDLADEIFSFNVDFKKIYEAIQ